MSALGLIAGGGALPRAVAMAARDAGREVFVAALMGSAEDWVADFAHEWVGLGEAGKTVRVLKAAGCGEILMAGKLQRPKFTELKLDAKGIMVLPKVVKAAKSGDDALLRCLVEMFAAEGFAVIGAHEAAPSLLAGDGVMGKRAPSEQERADIAQAFAIVRALGAHDVGQAAAVCEGLALAVEAAEGTDAMIARIGTLPAHFRGTDKHRKGVLVKAKKPTQDGKTDLPVIGLTTLRNAAAVGLAGIAVEAGGALILDKAALIDEADALGMFVAGSAT